jgi:hypothetical protein
MGNRDEKSREYIENCQQILINFYKIISTIQGVYIGRNGELSFKRDETSYDEIDDLQFLSGKVKEYELLISSPRDVADVYTREDMLRFLQRVLASRSWNYNLEELEEQYGKYIDEQEKVARNGVW